MVAANCDTATGIDMRLPASAAPGALESEAVLATTQ